jgi:hypothetical protein
MYWAGSTVVKLASVLLCLLLSGCVGGLRIKVSGTDHPVFSVENPDLIKFNRPCIDDITVTSGPASAPYTVWSTYTQSKQYCKSVPSIDYGSVFRGFINTVPAKKLDDKTVYKVVISSLGRTGFIKFKRINGLYTEVE